MSIAVTVQPRGGGALAGQLVRLEGEIVHAVLPRAFAPGAPIEMSLALEGGSLPLGAKAVGSRRRADGAFDVRMRPVHITRRVRDALGQLGP